MALFGKGGSSNKESGSSTTQGMTRFDNATMPIIPEYWANQNRNFGDFIGTSGVSPAQQANIGSLDALRGPTVNALQGLTPGMDAYTRAGYYSLADLSKNFGGEWATPAAVTAAPVNARTGASFMGAYRNPWDKDVIDASVADYNVNADRSLNAMRLGRDAAGAFGDRAAIADAVFNADAARGLGSLVSGLRQSGFNTAATLGQNDADRALTAEQANTANALAALQFNNTLTNNRQQFSVNQAMQGDQQRMQALRDLQNNILAQNDTAQANILAQSGIQQGGAANALNWLGMGTSTFGNHATGTGMMNSATNTNGKSSGKNGSIGLP